MNSKEQLQKKITNVRNCYTERVTEYINAIKENNPDKNIIGYEAKCLLEEIRFLYKHERELLHQLNKLIYSDYPTCNAILPTNN